MTSKTKDIVYGDVDLNDSEFEPRRIKVRVTTMIDEDVLAALKKMAKGKGQKYQTLLNQMLRSLVEKASGPKVYSLTEKRVRTIVREELRKKA